jgi:hypothetical protein
MGFLFSGGWVIVSGGQKEKTMNIEQLAREQKLAELEILRQSLNERNDRIGELEKKVELLETLLNRAVANNQRLPQPQPFPEIRPTPRRWAVR